MIAATNRQMAHMRANRRQTSLALIMVFILAGYANPTSTRYNVQDVGRVIETSQGTVVSSRIVDVRGGENSGAGALAGGVAGAAISGVTIGSGNGSFLATVLGGLIGAGAGYLAEDSLKSREGVEYVIRTDDDRIVTLVQNRERGEELLPGDARVLLQYGADYTQVVALPNEIRPAGGGAGNAWQNPDLTPLTQPPSQFGQEDEQ